MTVGMASDSTVTFLGYLPAFDPPEGDLDDTSFSHDGVEYSVDGCSSKTTQAVSNSLYSMRRSNCRMTSFYGLEIANFQYPNL